MPGSQETVLLFAIGLLILGPEPLPRAAIQFGRWAGKVRPTASQLRYQLEHEIALAATEEKKKRNESETEQEKRKEERANPGDGPCSREAAQSPRESQAKPDNIPTGDQQTVTPCQRDSADGATVTDEEDRL